MICAIRDGRDSITWADVIKAKHLKALGPGEDVEYIERERHAIAIHEACHAVVAYRRRRHFEIDIATIEKGGNYLGMVASIPPEDQFSHWRAEYEADIQVGLASLAGERMFFDGDNSSGVSGDLESATMLATLMEGHWGMGETISSYSVARHISGGGGGGRPGGGDEENDKPFDKMLGRRVEANLRRLYESTEVLLAENRREVLAVAHALERNKTLTGEDVAAVIDGVRRPARRRPVVRHRRVPRRGRGATTPSPCRPTTTTDPSRPRCRCRRSPSPCTPTPATAVPTRPSRPTAPPGRAMAPIRTGTRRRRRSARERASPSHRRGSRRPRRRPPVLRRRRHPRRPGAAAAPEEGSAEGDS